MTANISSSIVMESSTMTSPLLIGERKTSMSLTNNDIISANLKRAELKKILFNNGIESSSLDETVHDAASCMASEANNGGIDGQLAFLLDTCNWNPQDILKALEIKE
jgi:hypothetical protein